MSFFIRTVLGEKTINKDKVIELREAGLSCGEISKMLDMPRSSVISIVKRSQEPKCQWCGKRLHQKRKVRVKKTSTFNSLVYD